MIKLKLGPIADDRRNCVQRVSRFKAETGQEVAAPPEGGRIRPDIPGPRQQRSAIGNARCVIDAKQAALPERRLKDVIKCGLDLVFGHVGLADEAQNRGVESAIWRSHSFSARSRLSAFSPATSGKVHAAALLTT